MGFSVRYLLCRDGEIIKIPSARYERFYEDGMAEFPAYAGKILDMAEFTVFLENRQPISIARQAYFRVRVTDDGTVDKDFEQQMFALAAARICPAFPHSKGSVIEASEVFRERTLESRVTWNPSPSLKRRLVNIVLDGI